MTINAEEAQKPKIKFYRVWSDDFEGTFMDEKEYFELRLQMSTGDLNSHYIVRAIY